MAGRHHGKAKAGGCEGWLRGKPLQEWRGAHRPGNGEQGGGGGGGCRGRGELRLVGREANRAPRNGIQREEGVRGQGGWGEKEAGTGERI